VYSETIDLITRAFPGHVQVEVKGYHDEPELDRTIDHPAECIQSLSALPGFEAAAPRLFGEGLASLQESTSAGGALVIGVDPSAENRTTHLALRVVEGAMLPDQADGGALLGKGLATSLHAQVGSRIALQVLADDGLPGFGLYRVEGIVELGAAQLDRTACFLHLDDAGKLLSLPGRAHQIAVVLQGLGDVGAFVAAARGVLDTGRLDVLPWNEVLPDLAAAISADKAGMHVMIFIILLVVGIVTLNTVLMSVLERTRELGILRAIGTRPDQIAEMVLLETLLLCGTSAVLGVAIGTAANAIVAHVGIPLGSYEFEFGGALIHRMRTAITLRSILIPGLAALITGVLVAIAPALRAAHIVPARAFRM
jgi:putative ABC transport system permease protein